MFKIPKQEYTAEIKQQTVKRVRGVGSIGRVAKDLGSVEQTLRNGVKAAKAGKFNPAGVNAITPEQMALLRLWAEVSRLRMECEILKKRRGTSREMHSEVRGVVSQQQDITCPRLSGAVQSSSSQVYDTIGIQVCY